MGLSQTLCEWRDNGGTIKFLMASPILGMVRLGPGIVLFILVLYAIATYTTDPETVLAFVGWVAIFLWCLGKSHDLTGEICD